MSQWLPIKEAPFGVDLELAVLEGAKAHALVFPCRRELKGWRKSDTTREMIDVRPTHWQEQKSVNDRQ